MKNSIKLALLPVVVLCSVVGAVSLGEVIARTKYTPRKVVFTGCFEYHPKKKIALKKNYHGPDVSGISTIFTNQYGYRSEEITQPKQPREKRIAFLGDSVTYGHGIQDQDRFTTQVKTKTLANCPQAPISIINTGVPGYSIMQEYYDFIDIEPLNPDITVLQFTLNDITEPFIFQKELGGNGFDYHRVADATFWHFYLTQRSALYLFFYDLGKQLRFGTKDDTKIQNIAKKQEWLTDRQLVDNPDDDRQKTAWAEYFKWFDQFVKQCEKTKTKCVVLLTPYTFQVAQDYSLASPQHKLTAYAQSKNIMVIDMLQVLQEKIRTQIILNHQLDETTPFTKITKDYSQEIEAITKSYFLDYDHFTILGHGVVAETLLSSLPSLCDTSDTSP